MADYYPLITKAVEGLEKSTGEARRGLYDRARNALVTQLRGVQPALSESDITRERLALEEAIRKVEAEAARRSRRDSPPPPRSEPPPPATARPQTAAPETPQPNTIVSSEVRAGGEQADIPQPADAAAPAPSPERQAASLSALAGSPTLPLAEGADGIVAANTAHAESAEDSESARPQRPRWTPGGPSLSDKSLKGFRDVLGDTQMQDGTSTQAKTTRYPSAPNGEFETVEPRVQPSERRPEKSAEARVAQRGDAQTDVRTHARADQRSAKPADKLPDNRADKPAYKPVDIGRDPRPERVDRRTDGRTEAPVEPRGEPRAELRSQPRGEARGSLRAAPPSDMRAEPRVEPAPLRPSPRDARKLLAREPVVEPTGGREAVEPRRTRDAERPPRAPEPPLEEPEHDDEEFEPAARREYSTRPPSPAVRQEDVDQRAAAAPSAGKSERLPATARYLLHLPPLPKLTGEWRKFAALAIMGLLLVTVAAIGLWKQSELRVWLRNLPNFNRTADTTAPGDSTGGRTKITDRIGSAPITPQNPGVGALGAQQAVLYEEDQNEPAGKRFVGSTVWRTDRVSPAPGKPPEIAIRADIEIPEQRISLRWSLQRNNDKALPASHTVEVLFTLPPDFPHGDISDIPGVLMKQGESTRGVPLTGLRVKVTNNYFLIGLSSADADMQRNISLLKERSWFDIPVTYGDGKRAIIAVEKGTSGGRVFGDAFAAWGQ
jgi:hypothetical protein